MTFTAIRKVPFALYGAFAGISFRVLFFNVLLIFFAIASLLLINNHETVMLTDLEINANEQARFLTNSLAWKGELVPSKVRRIIGSQPWTYHNYIEVFDHKGTRVYHTNIADWDTGPDPDELKQNIFYHVLMETIRKLTLSQQKQLTAQQLETFRQKDVEKALAGAANTRMVRNGFEQAKVVLVSTFPIKEEKIPQGVVRVHRSANRILLAVYQFRWDTIKLIMAFVTVAALLNLVLSRTILKPIRQITNSAEKLLQDKDNTYSGSLNLNSSYNEILNLSKALTRLTDSLSNEVNQHRQFVDDLVHELKNPLASIRSAAEMAEFAQNNADKSRFLEMLISDVSRVERLLTGVKELSHIKPDSTECNQKEIDIKAISSKYVENKRQLFSTPLVFHSNDNDKIMLPIKKERYVQILDNLVENALSFTEGSKPVLIEMNKSLNEIVIEVKDRGKGIPEEHLAKIFNRFVSFREVEQKKEYSGLGLAIVKSIVESNKGQITAHNRKKGGCCFRIEFQSLT